MPGRRPRMFKNGVKLGVFAVFSSFKADPAKISLPYAVISADKFYQ